MKLMPLADKIVVRLIPEDAKTSGGLVLPEGRRSWLQQGRVLAVGDGWLLADGSRTKLQVSEGDRVLFVGSGAEVVLDGERLLILSEEEVLAVMD